MEGRHPRPGMEAATDGMKVLRFACTGRVARSKLLKGTANASWHDSLIADSRKSRKTIEMDNGQQSVFSNQQKLTAILQSCYLLPIFVIWKQRNIYCTG